MSVQNQIVKNVYEGNGSTRVFPYTFALNETDGEHVKVYIADESEVSTPTDNFTIDTQLRTVTYPQTGAALPEGSKIVIRRELPNEQDTNLENNGAFFAETIEREFDREVMMIQQLAEQVDRAVKTDMSSVTTPDELIAELRAKVQAAVESASAALVSENNAKASEQAAAQSETNAESYKDTTYGYMTTTEAYVSQAETSATTATNKATEASASASAAAQSKTEAEAAADTAYDYMIEAGASESIATQSATNAANSATAAATSEANARTLVNTVNPPWNIRMASTVYAVGDIAYSALLPSWAYIECTVGGTTDSGDLPVPSSVVANDTFTDGTVTWKIKKIGSGSGRNVGDIFLHAGNGENPQGALLCNGAAVSRTMYPDLFAKIGTTYGAGDGSTTFNLPNLSDNRFAEGSTTAGTYKTAGLPNITGNLTSLSGELSIGSFSSAGALSSNWLSGVEQLTDAQVTSTGATQINFNAHNSNSIYGASATVQPKSLTLRFFIQAFDGQTPDSALIDITQYAQELATKDIKGGSLPSNTAIYINDLCTWQDAYTAFYTAPADGYVHVSTNVDTSANVISALKLAVHTPTEFYYCDSDECGSSKIVGFRLSKTIPVRAGDRVGIYFLGTTDAPIMRFIYAKGALE